MKSNLVIALAAGAAISTGAYAQKIGVAAAPHQGKPRVQLNTRANRVDPVAMAGVRRLSGGGWMVSTPWTAYVPRIGHTDQAAVPAFDCYEADATGTPINFCNSGCGQSGNCPGAPDGARWFFGVGYLNPDPTNDMTVVHGAEGLPSTRADIAWNWGPATATQCFVILSTAEDFNDCAGTATGASNYYDGVILDFGALAGGGGYNFSDVDLTVNGGTLFWQLPMDGTGAYTYAFATAVDPTTGAVTLDTDLGTQPMLWGTGDAETPPDGRVGHQGASQWDDDTPPDGTYLPTECYDYTQTGDLCPNPWGAMVLFYVDSLTGGGGCYANCDHSTAIPFLNVNDFICFQTNFASGATYANCDNSTTPPVLNVNDFICFQTRFAAGCSAP